MEESMRCALFVGFFYAWLFATAIAAYCYERWWRR